jgi:hypothetical protein
MRNDFEPVHLKQANAELDKHVLSSERYQKSKGEKVKISLWQKFLRLFRTSPFELPEDLYKYK